MIQHDFRTEGAHFHIRTGLRTRTSHLDIFDPDNAAFVSTGDHIQQFWRAASSLGQESGDENSQSGGKLVLLGIGSTTPVAYTETRCPQDAPSSHDDS